MIGGVGYIGSCSSVARLKASNAAVARDNLANGSTQAMTGDGRKIAAVMLFAGMNALSNSVLQPLAYFANNLGGTLVEPPVAQISQLGRYTPCVAVQVFCQ